MNFLLFTALSLVAIIVEAQTPGQCVVDCANATCPSTLTNVTCFCDSANQTAILNCLQSKCTSEDVQAAQLLGAAICGKHPCTFHVYLIE